ncbi:MAG: BadF/BadG/BcrA/BcrD ATPase family protein [Comamonadaceae bacterium]|jgi:glucosamine kinase
MSATLGIDAGGSQTRWALVRSDQSIPSEGSIAGFSALELGSESGNRKVSDILKGLSEQVLGGGGVSGVHAGVSGFGGLQERSGQILHALLAKHFKLPGEAVVLSNDIELACLAAFEPGMGYLVYAGTGSIAGFVDAQREFHRAGGRGGFLDDGGSGYWITIQALRQIWRAEDEKPGCWVESPMAVSMFKAIGGSDWSCSRQLIYGASRGQIGQLALAVAAAADGDPAARDILQRAGVELARLGSAMIARFGIRPVVLAGRVPQLHRLIEQSMRERLPPESDLRLVNLQAHIAAARLALKRV